MNSAEEPPLQEQLKIAIANVRRQIEVQQASTHYVGDGPITAEAISELKAELEQLEQALADLRP